MCFEVRLDRRSASNDLADHPVAIVVDVPHTPATRNVQCNVFTCRIHLLRKVTKAVLILVEKEYKNHAWDRAKKMMLNVDQFKNRRVEYPPARILSPSCTCRFRTTLLQSTIIV